MARPMRTAFERGRVKPGARKHPLRDRDMRGLGRVPNGLACPDPGGDTVQDRLEDTDSGFGRLTTVRHAATMSETPPRWARPSVPLGTHAAEWPA